MTDPHAYLRDGKLPLGQYHTSPLFMEAAPNPENRRGALLHHHTNFNNSDFQLALTDGIRAVKTLTDRVVIVGGDLPDGNREYYHIAWDDEENTYKAIREGERKRITLDDETAVHEFLAERLPPDSFVFANLIYTENSPFVMHPPGTRKIPQEFLAA